jgi:hypothetical protein
VQAKAVFKLMLKGLQYLIVLVLALYIILGVYGYFITSSEQRKEIYLYGTLVYILILLFYLWIVWILKRIYRKKKKGA